MVDNIQALPRSALKAAPRAPYGDMPLLYYAMV